MAAVCRVISVNNRKESKSVRRKVNDWHEMRIQPVPVFTKRIEKKVLNAAWVAVVRKNRGKQKNPFVTVWAAAETHPIGSTPSMQFAHVERVIGILCTVIQTLGFTAEPVHDDANYICYTGSMSTKPQGVTMIGLRITDFENGNAEEIRRLHFDTESSVIASAVTISTTPRLVRKK